MLLYSETVWLCEGAPFDVRRYLLRFLFYSLEPSFHFKLQPSRWGSFIGFNEPDQVVSFTRCTWWIGSSPEGGHRFPKYWYLILPEVNCSSRKQLIINLLWLVYCHPSSSEQSCRGEMAPGHCGGGGRVDSADSWIEIRDFLRSKIDGYAKLILRPFLFSLDMFLRKMILRCKQSPHK